MDAERVNATAVEANNDDSEKVKEEEKKGNRHPSHVWTP